MNKDQYWQILRSEYGNRSPAESSFLSKYVSGLPLSFIYYVKIIATLTHASFPGRRGTLNDEKWSKYAFWVLKAVESVGGKVQIEGLEGVALHGGPVVFIGNHMSLLETLMLAGMVLPFTRINFVIKEELRHYPVVGHVMKGLKLIAVSRQNPREDFKVVMRAGCDFLAAGGSIFIFPQATRSVEFDAQAFNTLGVKVAAKAGVSVVPVAIKTDFQGNGKLIKDMGPIDPKKTVLFKFGKPIPVEGNGRRTHERVVEFITENLQTWGVAIKGQPETSSPAPLAGIQRPE